jgi:hypothetical protein
MDELMTLHPNGLFLRREALDFGYRDKDLLEARRAGVIERVRHGAYVPASTWLARDDIERYRLRGQAVCLSHEGGRVALSHTSGAAEHGLRLWDVNTDHVHVVRLDGAGGRRQRDVVYHEDSWMPEDVYAKDELLLLGPEECALGAASLTSTEGGVVIMDSCLDLDLGKEESIWAAYAKRKLWPHHAKLQITLRLMRPGAQSVGESRSRFLFFEQHLPEPTLQFKVYDDDGNLVGITDFAWPQFRLLGEFDGMIKYGPLLKPGQSPADALTNEKNREDRLREVTGWNLIRLIWADLHRRRVTAGRVQRLMQMGKVA